MELRRVGLCTAGAFLLMMALGACADTGSGAAADQATSSGAETGAGATTGAAVSTTGGLITSEGQATGETGQGGESSSSEGLGTNASTGDAGTTTGHGSTSSEGSSGSGATSGGTGIVEGCHGYPIAGDTVTITNVASLPTMTGGEIPLGTYTVVEAATTSTLSGTIRSSWVFEDADTVQIIQQLALSGPPPQPVARTMTWGAKGSTLSRDETCPGSESFLNQYTVEIAGEQTLLHIRQASVMFTYQLQSS